MESEMQLIRTNKGEDIVALFNEEKTEELVMQDKEAILQIKNLSVQFDLNEGMLQAVNGIDLNLKKGKTIGIVGESGSGKSVTAQALLQLVLPPGQISGELLFKYKKNGKETVVDLAQLNESSPELREIRGGEIAMIFQEPMKAFSPMYTIGNQIMESILLHSSMDKEEAREETIELLVKVGMSNPEQRFSEYPHQLSGGMRQRAMIAMAVSCNPSVLIADEPTTALDVTIQAQVLDLINELKKDTNASVLFITHDLGVIAEIADEVAVMYLGEIVEYTDVDTLFHGSLHPYTQSLLKAMPSVSNRDRLEPITGTVPTPINLPKGCKFFNRCPIAKQGVCDVADIDLEQVHQGHFVRCKLWNSERGIENGEK
jgi:peptide/nickel transport system ATP-binding protein